MKDEVGSFVPSIQYQDDTARVQPNREEMDSKEKCFFVYLSFLAKREQKGADISRLNCAVDKPDCFLSIFHLPALTFEFNKGFELHP